MEGGHDHAGHFFVGFFKVVICEFRIWLQSGPRETPEKN